MHSEDSRSEDEQPRARFGLQPILAAGALLLLLGGAFAVMAPFLSSLAWAFVMAFSLWPLHRRLVVLLRQRRTIAAMITTSAIALVLVVPTILIVVNLSGDARAIASAGKRWVAEGPPTAPAWLRSLPYLGNRAASYWDSLANDAAQLFKSGRDQEQGDGLQSSPPATSPSPQRGAENKLAAALVALFGWARRWIAIAGLTIAHGVTQIVLSVLLTFFIFRDGEVLGQRMVVAVNRIAGKRGVHLLQVAGSTVRGVVYGILGTALVQGAMAGVGFLIAGVPGAALLGLITFFLSPLPVGPPLVWIPAVIWLFHRGDTPWAIFMIVWGLAVSSVDNVIKPWIISHGSATPFILILFGVIGGVLAFGFIGVFLGPTLLAVTYRIIEEWSRESPPAGEPGSVNVGLASAMKVGA